MACQRCLKILITPTRTALYSPYPHLTICDAHLYPGVALDRSIQGVQIYRMHALFNNRTVLGIMLVYFLLTIIVELALALTGIETAQCKYGNPKFRLKFDDMQGWPKCFQVSIIAISLRQLS